MVSINTTKDRSKKKNHDSISLSITLTTPFLEQCPMMSSPGAILFFNQDLYYLRLLMNHKSKFFIIKTNNYFASFTHITYTRKKLNTWICYGLWTHISCLMELVSPWNRIAIYMKSRLKIQEYSNLFITVVFYIEGRVKRWVAIFFLLNWILHVWRDKQ